MLKTLIKASAGAVALFAITAGSANAQACAETQFTSKSAEFYLKAETELLQNDNTAGALAALQQLQARELNCYEEGAALRLGAAIKIESNDYVGAVRDLETALSKGYIPASEAKQTYYNISQIYLSTDNKPKALEYYDKWMRAGGQPDRSQKWTLAVLYTQLNRFNEAVPWAEQVLRSDGANAKREVYDTLIFLYDKTNNKAKKAQLLEQLLVKNPSERKLWDQIASDYFSSNNESKAFEIQKAMYLGGLLKTEDELMRIVNFYNTLDAPYQAAKVLEKEINAGRISKSYQRLELLANLYQVAREYKKAIPVIEEAAAIAPNGEMYERLGRSYSELREWANAEDALTKALNKGGLKNRGLAWVLIGQSRYERNDRSGAREAFRSANNRGGRGWIDFMAAEDNTARALVIFDADNLVRDLIKEEQRCKELAVIGELPEACSTVPDRLDAARTALDELRA